MMYSNLDAQFYEFELFMKLKAPKMMAQKEN